MSTVTKNLVKFLKEGYNIPEVNKEFKKRLSLEDYHMLEKVIDGDVLRDEYLRYYLNGYGQFELAEVAGLSKQRIAVILGGEYAKNGLTREEALAQHKESRERLAAVAHWYAGVYRSDKLGDLSPALDCTHTPARMNTLPVLYETYRSLGGTKFEYAFDEVDTRYWNPDREENEKEVKAVEMYMEGIEGHVIREELGLTAEELFRCYKRANRRKTYKKKKGLLKEDA
ncbi:hypothetical protein ACTFR8_22355 [Bacillus cereus group sp. MYBK15-3]|uniref:hypothetical protein n=1 Tax=Bacillus cereus group TaxID=86661 RepID=UPI001C8C740A|nr:hypothetical protein [Bacillus cereus]MBX9158344.1 hypothetical protein [Bacillus cereus]